MTSRKVVALLVGASLLVGGSIGTQAAAAKGTSKALVVGTDPEGDWGTNADPTLGPIGGPLGQDLVEASIGMADAKTINFIIKVTSLPPNGGIPEATRYTWELTVDDEFAELDGKWTNYSRGACDPTAGSCPPPRDPGMQPFLVRGDCADTGANVVACKELGKVMGIFDSAAGTITIPVPMAMLKAKPGTKIAMGVQEQTTFSGVSAMPSAFYSQASIPYDTLTQTKTFVVPR